MSILRANHKIIMYLHTELATDNIWTEKAFTQAGSHGFSIKYPSIKCNAYRKSKYTGKFIRENSKVFYMNYSSCSAPHCRNSLHRKGSLSGVTTLGPSWCVLQSRGPTQGPLGNHSHLASETGKTLRMTQSRPLFLCKETSIVHQAIKICTMSYH